MYQDDKASKFMKNNLPFTLSEDELKLKIQGLIGETIADTKKAIIRNTNGVAIDGTLSLKSYQSIVNNTKL